MISTDIKTHVIITFSKSHHFITRKQFEIAAQATHKNILLGDEVIATSNIAEILTIDKYYETYPDKKAKNYGQMYSELPKAESTNKSFKEVMHTFYEKNPKLKQSAGYKFLATHYK